MNSAIIVNATARLLVRRPALADDVEALAAGRAPVHRTTSLLELSAVARELFEARVERVILCGGDGTLMAGVTALARAYGEDALPELVLAPGGTVATVARNWGQRASLLETVRAALAGEPGTLAERPTLRLVADGGDARIGCIFGTGLVARFFDRYYADGASGYRTAAKIVAHVFAGSFVGGAFARSILEPMPCTLEVDGRALEPRAWSLVVCSVVRDLGLHLLVTHRAGEDPARPHLVASPLPPRKLGPQAPRVFRGRGLAGGFDDLVSELVLRFPSDPGPWVLDGDVFRSREVSVRAGPRVSVRTY